MFYALRNLTTSTVAEVPDPWNCLTKIPDDTQGNKDAYLRWARLPSTEHCFLSGFQGLVTHQRVDKDNPATFCHALIADYDGRALEENDFARVKKHRFGDIKPQYVCRSFSGGARLIWVMAAPVLMSQDPHLCTAFLAMAIKKLKMTSYFPALDTEAFCRTTQYYEVGHHWEKLSDEQIETTTAYYWMEKAGDTLNWNDFGSRIPIEDIHKQVLKQFPGRWQGPFHVGARGVLFWDEESKNPTSCVVRESGMQCFAGNQPFMSWASIFGPAFVDKYAATQIGAIMEQFFFDGVTYWKKDPSGYWQDWTKEYVAMMLQAEYNLKATIPAKSHAAQSELASVLTKIATVNRVRAAKPYLHRPSGIYIDKGARNLNICNIKPLAAADVETGQWGEGFPWVAGLIDRLFDPATVQYRNFLSWLHHFYRNAYFMDAQPGHAIFLVGEPGIGKTLLSNQIIGTLAGGFFDAADILVGSSSFTGSALDKPVLTLDDTVPTTDIGRHNRYSAMLKKIVANSSMSYEHKYHKQEQIEWMGRVVVSCNIDSDSIRLLPNMDISIVEKVCLYRCHDTCMDFPSRNEIIRILETELPVFARWILNWVIPEDQKGKTRFGIIHYHDKELVSFALQAATCYSFYEIIQNFLATYRKGTDHLYWEGTPTDLLAAIGMDDGLKHMASKYTATQVASLLGQLKARGYPLVRGRSDRGRYWKIPVDFHQPDTKEEEVKQ